MVCWGSEGIWANIARAKVAEYPASSSDDAGILVAGFCWLEAASARDRTSINETIGRLTGTSDNSGKSLYLKAAQSVMVGTRTGDHDHVVASHLPVPLPSVLNWCGRVGSFEKASVNSFVAI